MNKLQSAVAISWGPYKGINPFHQEYDNGWRKNEASVISFWLGLVQDDLKMSGNVAADTEMSRNWSKDREMSGKSCLEKFFTANSSYRIHQCSLQAALYCLF